MCLQIGDIRGVVGIAILALTQRFAWMFDEPDEYLNYQLGNTSLCWHNGRLLALMEGGMPFQAHVAGDGSLASVGPYDFDGGMTAATSGHPKVCPLTGEMLSFFYRCAASSAAPLHSSRRSCLAGWRSRLVPVPLGHPHS